MNSINQNHDKNDLLNFIHEFVSLIGLGKITQRVNFKRRTNLTLFQLLKWLLMVKLSGRSLYRATTSQSFTSRTVRNVLNDGRINWQRLVCLIAQALIKHLRPLIDHRRRLAFIVDDTLFSREYARTTELLARAYDHDQGRFCRGYRALTLGWSDANTFLPVNYALMSSKTPRNVLGRPAQTTDQRSLAGRRRHQAQRKMTSVVIELIQQALKNGVPAQYVLFDSWFSSPTAFHQLKQLGLDGLGMLKRSAKVSYFYRGRQLSVKAIYQLLKASNYHPKSAYQYSCLVQAHVGTLHFPFRLVFVANRHRRSSYLVLGTTQTQLRPNEIIQLYGRRWQIENYFKFAKQYLRLDKSQIQSYDGLCGHLAVVMLAYDLLAWQERQVKDDRTLGDLFYWLNAALPDIALADALVWLLNQLKSLLKKEVALRKSVIETLLGHFLTHLPAVLTRELVSA
ncbi:transposase [Lentilactobacillus raoultii]|uniref:Transposase n=1 Tax=Lentilactobacillus raoultii TaxID=1987503 RepID=A0ABW3PEH5_9LACO|nr:transposase [Lentilactobacillus raoultii]